MRVGRPTRAAFLRQTKDQTKVRSMAGSKRERRPGVWQLRVSVKRHDGKYGLVEETFRGTEAQADRALAKLVAKVDDGKVTGDARTIAQLAEAWLTHLESLTGDQAYSPNTIHGYRRLARARIVPTFGKLKAEALTAQAIDRWYAELRKELTVSSVRRIHAVLSGMLGQAVLWRWVDRNVAKDASPGKASKAKLDPDKVPKPEHVLALLEGARKSRRPEYATYLRVAAAMGARRGEANALRWADLDLERGKLRVDESVFQLPGSGVQTKDTKNHQARTVSLDATTLAELRAHRAKRLEAALACGVTVAPEAFIFSNDVDMARPWKPDTVTQFFSRLRDRLELPAVVLHSLRHFHTTELLLSGVPEAVVVERMGWRDRQMLSVYAHGRDVADEAAAEAIGSRLG